MADEQKDAPKIFVDSDWKEEAAREKEKAEREAQESAGADQMPEASFVEILQMIIMQASIGLGGYQDPQSGQVIPPNLMVAKHYIDLLELLKGKTEGNLSDEEQQIVDATLHELRMAFVQATNARGQQGGQQPGNA